VIAGIVFGVTRIDPQINQVGVERLKDDASIWFVIIRPPSLTFGKR
jgi:hypothetical protein